MNKDKLLVRTAIASALFAATSCMALADTTIITDSETGIVQFAQGSFGKVDKKSANKALKRFIKEQTSYQAQGNEEFSVRRHWKDALGTTHTQLTQQLNNLPVYGATMTIHSESSFSGVRLSNENDEGTIYAVSGHLATQNDSDDITMIDEESGVKSLSARGAKKVKPRGLKKALKRAARVGDIDGEPELAYVYLPERGKTKLAWKVEVKYTSDNGFEHDSIFYNAKNGRELTRHPQVFHAKSLRTYDMENQDPQRTNTSGTLLCTTNQQCNDASAQRAHDGASTVYDYYKTIHNRNGINNADMTMISSVHANSNWNNATWYKNQMFYGDGDGSQFGDLTQSLDIIGHELTHGVVQFTANLVYQNESGALNEAMADIMGVSAEAWHRGSTQPSWLLAKEAYTPNIAGDAMRYMNDPTRDNQSRDYYPDRYTGTGDNGGVHLNSGIANLAYSLLVDGGSHPQNKSAAQVPALGLDKSQKIFYRALTTYFNASTNFAQARLGTAQAAQDLYGSDAKVAVDTAWCAVGVGACPADPTIIKTLVKGSAATGLSASSKNALMYKMDVPTGATNINFALAGSNGDADLYVSRGVTPTTTTYDCKSESSSSNESCIMTGGAGTYYVLVSAYSAFNNLSLTGNYDDSSTTPALEPVSGSASNISVPQGQWARYTQVLPAGYSNLRVTIEGGSGDTDLYVTNGKQSTKVSYGCRSNGATNDEVCTFDSPAAGVWYLDLYGYSTSSNITLRLTATP
jgi:Zn-dependent metalloprotease